MVLSNDSGSGSEVQEEQQEATLYINSHILKIQIKTGMSYSSFQQHPPSFGGQIP